jgi:hypothetical protein
MDSSARITITTAQAADICRLVIKSGRVPCLWGKPGIGKTAIAEQIAKLENRKFFEFRTSHHEPTDLIAEMYVSEDGTPKMRPPEFFTYVGPAFVLFDEVNRGTTMMQNTLLGVVNEGRAGSNVAPDTLAMMMCCNYETDGGGVSKTIAAMGSRVVHFDLVADLDGWSEWSYANGIAPVVIAYNRFKRDSLHKFNPVERTGPCPRTWHILSDLYNAKPQRWMLPALATGTVGQEEGIGFLAYEDLYVAMKATSVDNILLNPTSAPVPADVNTRFALSGALADAMNLTNIDNVITYLERMPSEYNVFVVKLATGKKTELQQSQAFTRWFIRNQGKF